MAKLRLIIILALLVVIPLAVTAWMALRLLHSENEVLEKRFSELVEGQLAVHGANILDVLAEYERVFLEAEIPPNPESTPLRRLEQSLPICNGLLVISGDGNLLHPRPGEPMTRSETALLKRAERLLESHALIEASEDQATANQPFQPQWRVPTMGKGSVNSKNKPVSKISLVQGQQVLNVKGSQGSPQSLQTPVQGWLPWFQDEGLQLFFRRGGYGGRLIAFELNRARLVADIIGRLPATSQQSGSGSYQSVKPPRIVLRDSRGGTIYQWGEYAPEEQQKPFAMVALDFPLNAWRLEYFADPATTPAAATRAKNRFVLATGTLSLATILTVMAAFIYRESTRRIAEAANRVNFVNRVSHELRTPLTNIRLYAELLEGRLEQEEDPKAASYIAVVNQECARLSRLISNVLSFSRRQRNVLRIQPASFSPCELVQRLVRHFDQAFKKKGIQVETDLEYCPEITADADACEQILVNLLSNAEKYAAAGQSLRISSRSEDGHFVVSVADKGPGIPRHMREKVFAPFVRLGNRLDEGVSGTGIGLSIARDLARLHGGDLKIADSDHGACFELWLPARSALPPCSENNGKHRHPMG